MKPGYLLVLALFCWLAYGLVALLPRKRRLLRRVGEGKTNDELIRLANEGDAEAARLHRDSRTHIAVGVVIGVGLVLSRFF